MLPQFAIDLLAGTFYSVVSFTLFERVRLRKLDRRHYAEGLTNGWERLWYSRRDGENYTPYGERMLGRLSDPAGCDSSAAGGIALSPSNSGSQSPERSVTPPAYRAGGYTAVPSGSSKEMSGRDSASFDEERADDRPQTVPPTGDMVKDPPRRLASIA